MTNSVPILFLVGVVAIFVTRRIALARAWQETTVKRPHSTIDFAGEVFMAGSVLHWIFINQTNVSEVVCSLVCLVGIGILVFRAVFSYVRFEYHNTAPYRAVLESMTAEGKQQHSARIRRESGEFWRDHLKKLTAERTAFID